MKRNGCFEAVIIYNGKVKYGILPEIVQSGGEAGCKSTGEFRKLSQGAENRNNCETGYRRAIITNKKGHLDSALSLPA